MLPCDNTSFLLNPSALTPSHPFHQGNRLDLVRSVIVARCNVFLYRSVKDRG